ncbi:MAG: M28 family peptidase [Bacteroidia bacterium]|nr:M28 family peptidase [Bacteroidia bacterium]
MKYLFLVIICFFQFSTCAQNNIEKQSDVEKVKETVDKATIEGHIYFLADDLLKGRETGTPELQIAASYLANTFRSYGVKPNPENGTYYQNIPLLKSTPSDKVKISINGKTMDKVALIRSAQVSHDSDALFLGYGLEEDYKNTDTKNKVVIVRAGGPNTNDSRQAFRLRRQKQELAKQNGVKTLIELLPTDENMWNYVEHNFNTPKLEVPNNDEDSERSELCHIWLLDTNGSLANNLSAATSIHTSLEISAPKQETIYTQNIIGVVEGSDPRLKEEYIIYSAHYDHVGIGTADETGDVIYNGARDNAVGTTTVLSMAEHLSKYPTKRSALFILFTGEEKGLIGSRYYVENPVIPLNQMVFCFNSDNAGYNDTNLATIVGLPRTTAAKHITAAAKPFGITAVDDPAPEQGLFDRSDNVAFARAGIPAPTYSLGFIAFNGDVTKYYHRPGDEADTLDYDYLLKFFRSYVLAGRYIGDADETPFWTEGDKYFEAGKSLYKSKQP